MPLPHWIEWDALAREYKVMSIPTFLVFKDGKVAERTLGVQEKSELEEQLEFKMNRWVELNELAELIEQQKQK